MSVFGENVLERYKAGPTGETTISSNVSKRKAREAERAKSDEEAPEVKRQKMERKIDLYNRAMDKVISNTIVGQGRA